MPYEDIYLSQEEADTLDDIIHNLDEIVFSYNTTMKCNMRLR